MAKPDLARIAQALCRVTQELAQLVEEVVRDTADPPEPEALRFVPTAFQRGILAALEGKAMRTDDLARVAGDRRRLFRAGGLSELIEEELVAHHRRLGYYRPDAPPPHLNL